MMHCSVYNFKFPSLGLPGPPRSGGWRVTDSDHQSPGAEAVRTRRNSGRRRLSHLLLFLVGRLRPRGVPQSPKSLP